jgi:CubicO group peptidase (beta-lactamase class C family)
MLSRRAFIVRSIGATTALVALPGSGPFSIRWVTAVSAAPALDLPDPAWEAHHNLSRSEYQNTFDRLGGQGFRLIDVSGYEVAGQDRYSGIWEQSPGPAYVARHGISSADYQAAFDQLTAQGYRPVRVNGFGVGGTELFCAIFEQRAGPATQARHGLTGAGYQALFDQLTGQGYRLIDVSGYEAGGEPRYTALWEQTGGPAWVGRHGISAGEYQAAFDSLTAQGYRLIRVSGFEDDGTDHYAAIFEQSGNAPWQARHGVPLSDYQAVFDDLRLHGYRPLQAAGYAAGGVTRFATVWESRVFSGAELSGISGIVDGFMAKHNVPGLSLAIAKDDRLVFAGGYGTADKSTGADVHTNSRFRIASVTKPITSAAIFKLVEQNKLKLSDTVFGSKGLLGTTYGTQPYKANIDKITVQHLLEHTAGGWMNDGNDPMFQHTDYDHKRLITWTLDNRALDNAPGANWAYSNFGYCVLGRIIEDATGQSYEAWVQQNILAPCGISSMEIAGNKLSDRLPDEVVYYYAAEDPYGMNVSRMDSHGGWVATATDVVRFGVHVNGMGAKPDILSSSSISTMTTASARKSDYAKGWAVNSTPNWWHIGNLPGNTAVIVRTSTGMCWAALINTWARNAGIEDDLDTMMWDITKKVTDWPGYDLF